MSFGAPSIQPVELEPEPAPIEQPDLEELARRRRERQGQRRGTSSLVIDPATRTPDGSGLSIGGG